MSLDRTFQRIWYERSPFVLFLLLTPLSLLFAALSLLRRAAFRLGILRSVRVERPVLVVGNISVGGTGKTPLVIHLAWLAAQKGVRVGIVTRGYGGRAAQWPQVVTSRSAAEEVGDEAVLLASRTEAIVIAGRDRVASSKLAIERGAQLIISDDGLQHYRLRRDAEIIVVDAARQFGNGWLLPAGPLREGTWRLQTADAVVHTMRNGVQHVGPYTVQARHVLRDAINLKSGEQRAIASFAGARAHAVAGIGNPDAFFAMLTAEGLKLERHALADHARLAERDVTFGDADPVLMTEKDAVKCRDFVSERHWMVPLHVDFAAEDEHKLAALLDRLLVSARADVTAGDHP